MNSRRVWPKDVLFYYIEFLKEHQVYEDSFKDILPDDFPIQIILECEHGSNYQIMDHRWLEYKHTPPIKDDEELIQILTDGMGYQWNEYRLAKLRYEVYHTQLSDIQESRYL